MKLPSLDRIGRKTWSDEEVEKYVGPFASTYLTYATDERLRRWAASGGSTTAILLHLLDTGRIDGAMVVKGWVDDDGTIRAEFTIATTPDEIIAGQGSKYQAVRFGKRELGLIADFPGKLGFVLLPCDATKLAAARARRPEIDETVEIVMALYCGHNTEPDLVQGVAEKLGKGRGKVTDFHYRSGHWRGVMTTQYEDGTTLVSPHNEFKNHHNLYFFAQPKCNHCFDHFGYDCDISVGDIWTLAMRKDPIKHTAVITRSPEGEALLEEAMRTGVIHGQGTDIRDILDGQARTLPFHYNITARAKVGRLFGIRIKDPVNEKVRLVDLAVAFLVLLNQRISRSRVGRRIVLAMPRPVVRAYLMGIKLLEQM